MAAVFRFVAGCFLLVAVIAAVDDATRSLAADRPSVTSAGEHWSKLAPATFNSARSAVQRHTHKVVWDHGVRELLRLPSWALLGLVGLAFAYAGRRRRRVNIFAN
jgi:hypothetical protein